MQLFKIYSIIFKFYVKFYGLRQIDALKDKYLTILIMLGDEEAMCPILNIMVIKLSIYSFGILKCWDYNYNEKLNTIIWNLIIDISVSSM